MGFKEIIMNRLQQNFPNAGRRLTQVAANARQAYRHLPSAQSIVNTMRCQGPQATSVMEQQNIPHNSTRGGTSLDATSAATTIQNQNDSLRTALDK